MTKTLSEISEAMRQIDFCMLVSRAPSGGLSGRPMSNNREVEYEGTSWFFTCDDAQMVTDLEHDPAVGLTYQGSAGLKGLVGAPGMFIHVEGHARITRDKLLFAKHWHDELGRWFKQGVDTPGLTMIEVEARRIHYWDGEDHGEVKLTAAAAV
jgi:general stress protein 26